MKFLPVLFASLAVVFAIPSPAPAASLLDVMMEEKRDDPSNVYLINGTVCVFLTFLLISCYMIEREKLIRIYLKTGHNVHTAELARCVYSA